MIAGRPLTAPVGRYSQPSQWIVHVAPPPESQRRSGAGTVLFTNVLRWAIMFGSLHTAASARVGAASAATRMGQIERVSCFMPRGCAARVPRPIEDRSGALARPRELVRAESIDQRAERHAEELRGAGLIAGALFERGDDPLALRSLAGIRDRKS